MISENMDFFNKIDGLKREGLEIFFLTISGFLFLDLVTIAFYKMKLEDKFNEFTVYEITVAAVIFFCVFYSTKVIRFLIVTFIIGRFFSNNEKHNEYYNSNDLLREAVYENNSVKFNIYDNLKSERKKSNNLKHLNFLVLTMIITNACFENSAIRYISGFKLILIFLFLTSVGLLVFGLQENEDELTTTLIKKKEKNAT
jgi:hypothetical protein